MESIESQLIEILVCTVRQTATGLSPIGRLVFKRETPSTEESRTLVEDHSRLAKVLIPTLPQLC